MSQLDHWFLVILYWLFVAVGAILTSAIADMRRELRRRNEKTPDAPHETR